MNCGTLLLNGRAFSSIKGDRRRKLYECISTENERVLLPYEIKTGFSKRVINKYVLYEGNVLKDVIGDVNDFSSYVRFEMESGNFFRTTAAILNRVTT